MNQLGKPHGALGVSSFLGIISPAYFVASVGPLAHPQYVHHLLRSRLYICEYERRGKFMPPSQFDISWEQFRDINVLLPPLAQQRAIADFLDTEAARIDGLVAKKRSMIAVLSERFETAIFEAVTRGIAGERPVAPCGLAWVDEIPADWGTPPVSANFDLSLGKMLNGEAVEGTELYPYLRNLNVQWDRFDLADLGMMNFDADDRRHYALIPGDLLVCEGGEVGRAAVWSGEISNCFFQKAIHRVRPRRGANPRFLMYCLRAAAKQSVFRVEGNLSTIVHLTGEQLRSHRFPWPPASEQADIVVHLDRLAAVVGATNSRLTQQIDLLAEHRQALVTAAVTGASRATGVTA